MDTPTCKHCGGPVSDFSANRKGILVGGCPACGKFSTLRVAGQTTAAQGEPRPTTPELPFEAPPRKRKKQKPRARTVLVQIDGPTMARVKARADLMGIDAAMLAAGIMRAQLGKWATNPDA